MCEIALLNPRHTGVKYVYHLAENIFHKNNDGLGLVAIYRGERGLFHYKRYKSTVPRWQLVWDFLQDNQKCWRFAIHGRLATSGGTGRSQTHPIDIACKQCDVSMVMHNGMVMGSRTIRSRKEDSGHKFTTEVDTEVIAHRHTSLPRDLSDGVDNPGLRGQLAYILFGTDRILVRSDNRYTHNDGFNMGLYGRNFVPDDREENRSDREWLLAKPDGTVQTAEANSAPRRKTTVSGSYGAVRSSASQWGDGQEQCQYCETKTFRQDASGNPKCYACDKRGEYPCQFCGTETRHRVDESPVCERCKGSNIVGEEHDKLLTPEEEAWVAYWDETDGKKDACQFFEDW